MAQLEHAIAHTRDQLARLRHIEKIAAAMAPDPREWQYTGEIIEGDPLFCKCACGHPIKWLFPIERARDGMRVHIGSVCIDTTVPYLIATGAENLAHALLQAQARLEAQLAEQKRRETEARNNERCRKLQEHAESLQSWYKDLIAQIRRVKPYFYLPRYFYNREYRALFAPPLSTPGRTAASLARKIKTFHEQAAILKRYMEEAGIGSAWIAPPAMPKEVQS